MSSGFGMRRRRRRGYSDDALDNVRLKNSRAGYLSRVTTLRRSIEPLFNDIRNVNEVAEKLLEIDNTFHCFEKAHYILIRCPAQPNIKHLSCNKQPLMGCVNTSRV